MEMNPIMDHKSVSLLLDVFTTCAVGRNEPRGKYTRDTIDPAELTGCYVDTYMDLERDILATPESATVLDKLGRKYLCDINRPQLHSAFFRELDKFRGCPATCIALETVRRRRS